MIKEIGFFKQTEATPILASMLETESSSILKISIIETLGKLGHQEVEPNLFKLFPMTSKDVQRAIIKAITHFKTAEGLGFLCYSYNRIFDNELKIEVAYAIQQYGEEGSTALRELSAKSNEFGKKIFDQVTYQSGL
ncbi:HEAT repeat domain-containing protein [Sphingobacterium hotanense]|uniref:HEAT repeat domain-containing protein n=2 Tax=Sphingobacterium hotanense TaxID=649196 RepID=A0ABT7NLG4_9SPHI|nr:HEAT repeat domain-containing protein [Sphingobacterium hotanense]MDM1047986.1 HEAT repeat domain-containing protein [Sphingobacterium hotanense]